MPTARVTRTLYFPYRPDEEGRYGAAVIGVHTWGGASLHRTERLTYEIESDYCMSLSVRHSHDNGDSFSDLQIVSQDNPQQGDLELEHSWFAACYDPLREQDVRFDFQRIFVGTGPEALAASWQGEERYFDHGFYCVSPDKGHTGLTAATQRPLFRQSVPACALRRVSSAARSNRNA